MLSAFEARGSMEKAKLPESVILSEEDCSTVDKLVNAVEQAVINTCEIGFSNIDFIVRNNTRLTDVIFNKALNVIEEHGYKTHIYGRNNNHNSHWSFEVSWSYSINY